MGKTNRSIKEMTSKMINSSKQHARGLDKNSISLQFKNKKQFCQIQQKKKKKREEQMKKKLNKIKRETRSS